MTGTAAGLAALPIIDRAVLRAALRDPAPWDVLVIGGGATGLGIAVDAASRGFRTALIDAADFSGGTSSRSTKLIHGGVRYLAQGNVKLVREALAERALLLANAPALVRPLEFIVPCYRPFEREFLRIGLGLYDGLAGARGIESTRWLSRRETLARLPGVRARGLHGGVSYWDAQFDDARLAIALMRTAHAHGAIALNHVRATALQFGAGTPVEVEALDAETGERFRLRAQVVFNAAGVWVDGVRQAADPTARPLVTVSRGSHLVVGQAFLPAASAMMIPKTSDGRVLFAIPWHGRLLVGTTDVKAEGPAADPQPSAAEVAFMLETANAHLEQRIEPGDVLAQFAGLRPLFAPGGAGATATISREHAVVVEHGRLITVTGGKWTTYRRMAIDALAAAEARGLLPQRPCVTASMRVIDDAPWSTEALARVEATGSPGEVEAFARHAMRCELALRADDVLDRRLRIGQVDRARAEALRPAVTRVLAGG